MHGLAPVVLPGCWGHQQLPVLCQMLGLAGSGGSSSGGKCRLPSSSCSPSREIPGDSTPVRGAVGPGSAGPGVGMEGRAVPQSQLLAQQTPLHKTQHRSNPSRKS